MTLCTTCGEAFTPLPGAWGGETCGHCLASWIELQLLKDGQPLERKALIRQASAEIDIFVAPALKRG